MPDPVQMRIDHVEVVMRGLEKMCAEGWSMVCVDDGRGRYWCFAESEPIPVPVEGDTPYVTAGGVIRMGWWNTPTEALADLGKP